MNEDLATTIAVAIGALIMLFGAEINSGVQELNDGVLYSIAKSSEAIHAIEHLIQTIDEACS